MNETPTVKISSYPNEPYPNESYCLKVEFINTLNVCVRTYKFYNYIGNGDNLARAASDWVNDGLFPDNGTKGLVLV